MKMNSKNLSQCSVIIGAFLVCLPIGIPWYYGNLNPYLISYFRNYIGPAAFDVQTDWLLSTLFIMGVLSIFTVDWLVNKFGAGSMHIAACFVFDFGMFVTYFTVQYSVGLTMLTLMMCCGSAIGQVMMISLMFASRVEPSYVGMATSFIASGFGLGAILFNVITTAYINPDNLAPDIRHKTMAYFSQPDILDKVPGVFITLGLTSVGFHLLGLLLEQLPLFIMMRANGDSLLPSVNEKTAVKKSFPRGSKNNQTNSEESEPSVLKENGNEACRLSSVAKNNDSNAEHSKESTLSLKPYAVLRSRSFYLLWLSIGILTYGGLLTQNFYKLFGQLWIRDDSFLTFVGSAASVTMSLYRIAIGCVMDRIGVKNTMVVTMSLHAGLTAFWYFTPRLDRWLYFACFQAITAVQGSVFTVGPISVLRLFGPTHYATNYGLLMTANLTMGLVCPPLYPILLGSFGWYGLIIMASASSVLVLIPLVLFLSPDK